MPIELYINDEALDLEPGEAIAVTKQINDIADVGKIKADGSNQFRLPKTARNRRILENAGEITTLTDMPYQLSNAKLLQDGIELLVNAKAVIESTDDAYNIQVVSGNKNFFDLIDGLNLTDLNLSAYTHQWHIMPIINSRLNNDGFIYPIIQTGNLGHNPTVSNHEVPVKQMHPAFYIHTLWRMIAEAQGYTWESDFIDSDLFRRLLLFHNTGKSIPLSEETANLSNFEVTNSSVQDVHQLSTIFGSNKEIVEFDTIVNDPFYTYNTSTNEFHPFYSGTYTFLFSCDLQDYDDPYYGDTQELITNVYQNGDAVHSFIESNVATTHIEHTFTLECNAGDTIQIGIYAKWYKWVFNPVLKSLNISGASTTYFSYIEGNSIVPSMSQKDFIKAIANMFGLVFQCDKYRNIIHVKRFNQIKENLGNAIDWSQKLDLGKQHKIEYRFGNFAQTNRFLYSADESNPTWKEGLGDGSFTIADENLPLKADLVKLPFSSSPMIKRLCNLQVPDITLYSYEGEEGSEQWTLKHAAKPRILVLDRQDMINGNNILYSESQYPDGIPISQDIPLCHFQLPGNQESLGYSNNLLNTYYDALQDTLDHAKKITAYFKLTQNDIAELDHFIPIYIEYFGNYFYINKIHNFVNGKSTKCELIRL